MFFHFDSISISLHNDIINVYLTLYTYYNRHTIGVLITIKEKELIYQNQLEINMSKLAISNVICK